MVTNQKIDEIYDAMKYRMTSNVILVRHGLAIHSLELKTRTKNSLELREIYHLVFTSNINITSTLHYNMREISLHDWLKNCLCEIICHKVTRVTIVLFLSEYFNL